MKRLFIFFLLISLVGKAQERREKLGFFGSIDANMGIDLVKLIRKNTEEGNTIQTMKPGKFSYGFASQIGFQPLDWFSVSSGLRYNFIDPNFHLLYFTVNPYFFIGDKNSPDYHFIFAKFGNKINRTAVEKAAFVSLGFGKIEPLNEHVGHQFQIAIEDQILDNSGNFFIGLTYGIVFFSKKN